MKREFISIDGLKVVLRVTQASHLLMCAVVCHKNDGICTHYQNMLNIVSNV